MKKIIAVAVLALALAGCSSQPQHLTEKTFTQAQVSKLLTKCLDSKTTKSTPFRKYLEAMANCKISFEKSFPKNHYWVDSSGKIVTK